MSALTCDLSPVRALPAPNEERIARSQLLARKIERAIDSEGGGIGFDRYMEMALYDPALGYYHASWPIFGARGDFVTSPEISPLFAWSVARSCARALDAMNGGDVLEFGAGSGSLAVEALAELERVGALPGRYYILELSAELRARQHELLRARAPHLLDRVAWLSALPAPGFRGVVLANEVLDAMPVRCFALRGGAIFERRVTLAPGEGGLAWTEKPADARLQGQVSAILETLPESTSDDYSSELNPALNAWMKTLAQRLSQALVLIIDYGYPRREYYHPERRRGTLLCHYRHRAHDDPFFYPGLQDISANVDFTAVAEAGAAANLDLLIYTTQAQFLLGSGLIEFFARATDDTARLLLSHQVQRLTFPGEMGERFQVMALGKNIDAPQGFTGRDFRARL